MKKIGIASDHAGYEMKEFLVGYLNAMGYEVLDFGAHSPESVDYADFAHPLAEAIENGELERGVALCGSGEGMTMTLNKHQGIRADRLNQLKAMQTDGTFDMLPKKEVMKHLGEIEKLEKYLGGVKDMKKLPGALFIVDTRKERNAIAEAHKLGIPVVAIADTNCDPDEIDYVIPGNDDAIRAIKLIASVMANAMLEGKQGEQMDEAAEAPAAE